MRNPSQSRSNIASNAVRVTSSTTGKWHQSWTGLAARAPVAAPLLAARPELLGADRGATVAWLPRPLEDVARLPGRRSPVVDCSARDRLACNSCRPRSTMRRRLRRYRPAYAGGRHAGRAAPRDRRCRYRPGCAGPAALHQSCGRAEPDPPDSVVEVPVGAEEVWAKMSDNGVLISGRNQFHDGEPVAD